MKTRLYNYLLITVGWFFIVLGAIGAVLPLIPTTPFLIIALACFSKSSPRFHQMLLDNPWFGSALKQWEAEKTMSRRTKYRAVILIIITFSISIIILNNKLHLQLLLLGIAIVLLFFIWKIREKSSTKPNLTHLNE